LHFKNQFFFILHNNGQIKTAVFFILKLFAFWMVLFTIERIFFLAFYHAELKGIPVSHILLSLMYGLTLDISAASYLIFIPLVLVSVGMLFKKTNVFFVMVDWLNYLFIIFCLLIYFIGIGLYANWGQKINSKALSFLIYPKEIAGMIMDVYNILYFGIFMVFAVVIIFAYKRFFKNQKKASLSIVGSIIFFIFFSAGCLLGVRGGFQQLPIDKSWCYYSKHSTLNFASLNDFWNFFDIIVHPQIKTNPYIYTDKVLAEKTISELYNTADSTEYIVKNDRPNIVLIIMESMSADAIACFGGEPGIAPKFDTLAKESLLFSNFYATGFRTDQGMGALVSSFPAQPVSAIISNFGKFDHLPSFIRILDDKGYNTSYYFGGDLLFANTKTYLQVAGVDRMAGKEEVPHTRETDWGAYDEDVYKYQLSDIGKYKQPFFSMIMTLTNHEYFTADVEKINHGSSENDLYHNTAHYADKCLYDYIQQAKKQNWYNNTLFIITGDHAHKHPLERSYNVPDRHHIPLLICGGALKDEYRGKVITKTASHLDMAATILGQLKIKNTEFKWSKNFLNKYSKGFAFYTFDNGFGFITDSTEVVYDHNLKSTVVARNKIAGGDYNKSLKQGKAFLQIVFQEYIDL
jgi:phosphoglycerol transferase MdoB-like AlkP superfamily enzyme